MSEEEISGYIDQDGIKAIFVEKDYHFTFVPAPEGNPSLPSCKNCLSRWSSEQKIIPINNFIHGKTFHGQEIFIYSPLEVDMRPTGGLNTWLYIISKQISNDETLNQYRAIKFSGGSLESVFFKDSLRTDSLEDGFKVTAKSDKLVFDIDESTQINVMSQARESLSHLNGVSIANTGTSLILDFQDNVQRLSQKNEDDSVVINTFINSYHSILFMTQFMTYRKNVYFDKILLLGKRLEEKAVCHVKNDSIRDPHRQPLRCITFNSLTSTNVSNLYTFIKSKDKKKAKISIDFIPETRKDISYITLKQLRDVCTATELEASLSGIKPNRGDIFYKLREDVKKLISNSKIDASTALTEREYSYIDGNISHWDGPAAELAKNLFDQNKNNILPLMNWIGSCDLAEENIQAVIKIRNSATHGNGVSINESDAETTIIMIAVIYSSILKRCGVGDDFIKVFISNGLIHLKD